MLKDLYNIGKRLCAIIMRHYLYIFGISERLYASTIITKFTDEDFLFAVYIVHTLFSVPSHSSNCITRVEKRLRCFSLSES